MKLAILSDIHANLAALDAVLEEVRSLKIERLVLLGDYVGYYYQPAEVIARLRAWPCDAILGNHDLMLLECRENVSLARKFRNRYGTGFDVALETLSSEDWDWLAALPRQKTISVADADLLLAHGAPFDDDCYVYPDAEAALLDRVRSDQSADVIWLGHTHWPFCVPGRPAIANPGSVGQPRDLGGAASWAVFDASTGAIAFRRTLFPVEELEREVSTRDPTHERNRAVLKRRAIPPGSAI